MATLQEKVNPSTQQYLDIKNQYKEYLIFYRMGDFYELFFEDAITASQALDLVLTHRGTYKGKKIPMCGVPFHAYENYLARLIKQGFKVAIAEQTETPEEAKKRGRSALVKREVIRLVTSGTLTEDTLLDARQNNYLMAVSSIGGNLGFSWLDLSTGDFFCREIAISTHLLSEILYSVFINVDPSEIIVSDSLYANQSAFKVLSAYQNRLTVLPFNRFNADNAQKTILSFYGISSLDIFGALSKAEISSAGILLDYLCTTQIQEKPHIKNLKRQNTSNSMEIDPSSRRNLELCEGFGGNKQSSLLVNIDKTVTGAGARLFLSRLLSPSTDENEINNRLDAVQFFLNIPELQKEVRSYLKQITDMERVVSRLALRRGGPKDMFSLKIALLYAPKIRNLINNFGNFKTLVTGVPAKLKETLSEISDFSALADELDRALKDYDELPTFTRDGDFIKEGYSPTIDELKNYKNHSSEIISNLEKAYSAELGIPNLKIKYNSIAGRYLEVPNRFANAVSQNSKFIHKQTVLNALRYTTAELTDLEQKISSLDEKILNAELEIFQDLTIKILTRADEISKLALIYAKLDVAVASAELALKNGYVRPIVDRSLVFEIKDGRHPVVENSLKKSHEGPFVTNNCLLNAENDRIWLLTGPNMAGKSTFLRQNAVIAIMAQMGLFVPALFAHIGIIDKVFSRVGASDDLSQGRSTFMVEMVETATILNNATDRSFVILDEIGRGTATYDGLSIAWSVIEHLHEINKCRTLFATHYHELTVLKEKLKALTLHAMKIKEFEGNVVFMHEVIEGTADRSYGIHVAKLAGLPKLAVKRAEQILKTLENQSHHQKMTHIEDDLPLFSSFIKINETEHKKEKSPLYDMLEKLNPDNLTPKEALDKLYELKVLYNDTQK